MFLGFGAEFQAKPHGQPEIRSGLMWKDTFIFYNHVPTRKTSIHLQAVLKINCIVLTTKCNCKVKEVVLNISHHNIPNFSHLVLIDVIHRNENKVEIH